MKVSFEFSPFICTFRFIKVTGSRFYDGFIQTVVQTQANSSGERFFKFAQHVIFNQDNI